MPQAPYYESRYIRANHPDLNPEFTTRFRLAERRAEWLTTVKNETKKYKERFRNLENQDIEPIPGQLVLFPSWLAHQALPYSGEKERVIISFNASVHGAQGDQLHSYSAT